MRWTLLAVLLALASPAAAQKLYKHVDANGNVVFTDRPVNAGQKAEKPKTANVASPEAVRQLEYAERERRREERAERAAQQQRYLSQRRREAQAERERRAREADPYSPIQDPARPRVRVVR
jgi:hypothetical protein